MIDVSQIYTGNVLLSKSVRLYVYEQLFKNVAHEYMRAFGVNAPQFAFMIVTCESHGRGYKCFIVSPDYVGITWVVPR